LVNQDKLILDSISNFLLRIKDSRLWSECGIFIEKSREAYLDGHFEASQTLNVATLDSFLIANFAEWKIYKKLSDKYKEPDIETMQSFEELYDFGAFGPVISAYQDGKSADNFSRHKTSHELSLIQVNRLNAIKSLTIVSGLLARFWAYEERLREN
jgi:hypothetical protein